MEVNTLAPSPDRRAARSRLFLIAGIFKSPTWIIHIIMITQMLADNEASKRSHCAEKKKK